VNLADARIGGSGRAEEENPSRKSVYEWLSPPDLSMNHDIARAIHPKGTTTWFLQERIFQEWKEGEGTSLLWIHGECAPCFNFFPNTISCHIHIIFIAGSGKSVLWFVGPFIILLGLPTLSVSSAIIEHIATMCKARDASMAYFYFDSSKQHPRNLLPSLLIQLSAHPTSRFKLLSGLYSAYSCGDTKPDDPALVCQLKLMLSLPIQRSTYLVMDAVDKCPNTYGTSSPRQEVLQLVKELVDLRNSKLHICVTSNTEVDLELLTSSDSPFKAKVDRSKIFLTMSSLLFTLVRNN